MTPVETQVLLCYSTLLFSSVNVRLRTHVLASRLQRNSLSVVSRRSSLDIGQRTAGASRANVLVFVATGLTAESPTTLFRRELSGALTRQSVRNSSHTPNVYSFLVRVQPSGS